MVGASLLAASRRQSGCPRVDPGPEAHRRLRRWAVDTAASTGRGLGRKRLAGTHTKKADASNVTVATSFLHMRHLSGGDGGNPGPSRIRSVSSDAWKNGTPHHATRRRPGSGPRTPPYSRAMHPWARPARTRAGTATSELDQARRQLLWEIRLRAQPGERVAHSRRHALVQGLVKAAEDSPPVPASASPRGPRRQSQARRAYGAPALRRGDGWRTVTGAD